MMTRKKSRKTKLGGSYEQIEKATATDGCFNVKQSKCGVTKYTVGGRADDFERPGVERLWNERMDCKLNRQK